MHVLEFAVNLRCFMPAHDHHMECSGTFVTHVAFSVLIFGRTESVNSDIRVRIIEDLCPPPAENLPRDVRERAEAAVVAGRRREKTFYICRELQLGAAVGVGGTVMATGCGRRPIRGVLGALALNRRRCRGPTAIEPEVALIMANLAKVGESTTRRDMCQGPTKLVCHLVRWLEPVAPVVQVVTSENDLRTPHIPTVRL